jgi:hypothetical protein
MENSNIDLSFIVSKALEYYDIKKQEYKDFLNITKISLDRDKGTFIFLDNNKEFKYEVLGIFDNTTNIWMWAWMVPEFFYNETNIVKKLLNYGLKLTPNPINLLSEEQLYLKTQLINSRFLLHNQFQLELHLAISSYLAKSSFKFIYSKKKYLNKTNTKYITVYYLII